MFYTVIPLAALDPGWDGDVTVIYGRSFSLPGSQTENAPIPFLEALASYPDAATVAANYEVTVTGNVNNVWWYAFPAGCHFKLINLATIYGKGNGMGGEGGLGASGGATGTEGQVGSDAIHAGGYAFEIDNGAGFIFGGGGGGGGGGGKSGVPSGYGGGGGGGQGGGVGGLAGGGAAGDGTAGTFGAPGTGGAGGGGGGAGGGGEGGGGGRGGGGGGARGGRGGQTEMTAT